MQRLRHDCAVQSHLHTDQSKWIVQSEPVYLVPAMFERITLDRPGGPVKPIDLGVLAECLVFYGTVRVIVDQVTFPFLVRSCGAEELLDLMNAGSLELEYIENLTGVIAKQIGNRTVYDYVRTLPNNSMSYMVVARKLFDDLAKPTGKGANRRFDRFAKLVKRSDYSHDMGIAARTDWADQDYTTQAARALLSFKSPHYQQPQELEFRGRAHSQGVELASNIDFDTADADYRQLNNIPDKTISPAYVLNAISNTRRDLIVASTFGSEFALAPEQSLIAACKFGGILKTALHGQEKVDVFQEDVLDDLPNVRDAINSGARNFSDVVRLVEKAERFKKWLREQDSNEHLRKSYLREVMHVDWADTLSTKALRWLIFTAAGLPLSPLAGVGLGAADAFILDKLIKGWRPNQFIEGPLKDFLRFTTGVITL